MRRIDLDFGELSRLYLQKKLSVLQIAPILGVGIHTVYNNLRRYNIPARSTGEATRLAFREGRAYNAMGVKSSNWRGGRYKAKDRYVFVAIEPSDPLYIMRRSGKNYIAEHRLVMAGHLGRPLKSNELVHHINEIRDDNRIENLRLVTRRIHSNTHHNWGKGHKGWKSTR